MDSLCQNYSKLKIRNEDKTVSLYVAIMTCLKKKFF